MLCLIIMNFEQNFKVEFKFANFEKPWNTKKRIDPKLLSCARSARPNTCEYISESSEILWLSHSQLRRSDTPRLIPRSEWFLVMGWMVQHFGR